MTWVTQTFVAIALLTPAWLGAPFFKKNFDVASGVYSGVYFLGVAITILATSPAFVPTLVAQPWVVASILGIGLAFGGIANALLFDAVTTAPNPGMPIALCNSTGMLVFLSSLALGYLLPQYFPVVEWSARTFAGIVLVIIGAALIAIR